jgi:hypothetical protein
LAWKNVDEAIGATDAGEAGIVALSILKPLTQHECPGGGEKSRQKVSCNCSAFKSIKKEDSNVLRQPMTPETAIRA